MKHQIYPSKHLAQSYNVLLSSDLASSLPFSLSLSPIVPLGPHTRARIVLPTVGLPDSARLDRELGRHGALVAALLLRLLVRSISNK